MRNGMDRPRDITQDKPFDAAWGKSFDATQDKPYLFWGTAPTVPKGKDRVLRRALEMLPGALAWTTLIAAVLFSWLKPLWVAIFIIVFDMYWILRAIYLATLALATFRRLRRARKTDWLARLEALPATRYSSLGATRDPEDIEGLPAIRSWKDIHHLIILPMFQEGEEVVRPTLEALAEVRYPKERMMVVLAVEERAGENSYELARRMERAFQDSFGAILVTRHPGNISGELAGKGSNEAWAARKAVGSLVDVAGLPYENVLVSSFDIDTHVEPDYFLCVTYHYLTAEKPLRSSYQPIPLFNNNIWDAPAFSRIAATSNTVWQLMQQHRPEAMETFSSHTMPLKALVEIGYWNTRVVSEDSLIFYQCLLAYDGDWRVVPLYYPVSMDANLAKSTVRTALNVYRQQRRWGYGAEKIAYTLTGFLKNKKIPIAKKARYTYLMIEGFWMWACAALIIFALGWLPLVLGGEAFRESVLGFRLPTLTRTILTIGMVGMVVNGLLSLLLLPPKPKRVPKWVYATLILQWVLFPVTIIVFGAFPGLEAQTRLMLGRYMGFWVTEKVRKSESQKPM